MLTHLSEEELLGVIAGSNDDIALTGHLEICPQCREGLRLCRQQLLQLRESIEFSSQRPAMYWESQRQMISTRLRNLSPLTGSLGLGWSLVCYGLALSVLLLAMVNFQQVKTAFRPPSQISDAALLRDMENQMSEDVPEALQPTGLLVSEMGERSASSTQVKTHTIIRTLQQ